MSETRASDAQRYHEPLAAALALASDADKQRVLKKAEVGTIYEQLHGPMDDHAREYMLASDHCDRPTQKGTNKGRCPICVDGNYLLIRVGERNSYRIRDDFRRAVSPNEMLIHTALTFAEGRRLLRLHRTIERNRALIAAKKSHVLESLKTLTCEVCCFNFATVYGELGDGYAECHHRTPMAAMEGVRESRIEDLAIVCANCHRMLHRQPFHTIDELRTVFESRNPA
jgi:hypothetical protein